MMNKIVVSYRPKKGDDVQKMVINIPSDINIYSDQGNDYCDDFLTDFLGYHPRWIRVDGYANIS